ncbi:MAG: rhomboid family intramembrane serine protease [Desulfobacterales bacterium]|nr:rhomboid family intramembrane serine protease [Desulfobacterales bacterium]
MLSMAYQSHRWVIYGFISVNILMYSLSVIFSLLFATGHVHWQYILSPSNQVLLALGASGTIPIDKYHFWWSLVCANYLHSGILHLLVNMFAFNFIARIALDMYGISCFVIIYCIGGCCGFALSYLANVQFTLGASSAICAIIGAVFHVAVQFKNERQQLFREVIEWIVSIAVIGMIIPKINNWAHGGGLLTGIFLGFLLRHSPNQDENRFYQLTAWGCIITIISLLFLSIFIGIECIQSASS